MFAIEPDRVVFPSGGSQSGPARRARDGADIGNRVLAWRGLLHWAARLLSGPKQRAFSALLAFCRDVENIADGDAPRELKLALLFGWRSEFARIFASGGGKESGWPQTSRARIAIARALGRAVRSYDLPCDDFLAIIAGAEMDARSDICAPSLEELDLYCSRVAVAACRIGLRVIGVEPSAARRLATELGSALQLTKILRDLAEDAGRQRLYLPRELLREHGIFVTIPSAALADPAAPKVCAKLADVAQAHFETARQVMATLPRWKVWPASVMLGLYRAVLCALQARGWQRLDDPLPMTVWRTPRRRSGIRRSALVILLKR